MALESSEWEMFLRRMIARNLRMFGAPDPVAVAKKDAAGRLQEWSRAQVVPRQSTRPGGPPLHPAVRGVREEGGGAGAGQVAPPHHPPWPPGHLSTGHRHLTTWSQADHDHPPIPRWQFEEEIKALGAEEVRAEFTGYFSAIVSQPPLTHHPGHQVSELGSGNARYGEAVRQLEGLLELERETLSVRRKVAAYTVDFDDDLVTGPAEDAHSHPVQASTAVSMDIFKTGANTLLEQSKGIQGRKAAAMAELVAAIPGLEEVQPITQVGSHPPHYSVHPLAGGAAALPTGPPTELEGLRAR